MPRVNQNLNPDPAYFKGDNRPVEQVSWYDAIEFCKRISAHTCREYRLPRDAEWEYACRAGTTTLFNFGDTITSDFANYDGRYAFGYGPKGEYRRRTTDVGNFPANGFGLYDMHGNVSEWCLDRYSWNEDGDSSLRVLRGGSWFINPDYCRSANRNRGARDNRYYSLGFRVVCVSLTSQ
jgi:formylglycine-generating enzyme required for sulfatase activity